MSVLAAIDDEGIFSYIVLDCLFLLDTAGRLNRRKTLYDFIFIFDNAPSRRAKVVAEIMNAGFESDLDELCQNKKGSQIGKLQKLDKIF